MPSPWPISDHAVDSATEPPFVMGVIRATHQILEMENARYLDWLDSRIRQFRLDGADIIELDFETRNSKRIEACEEIAPAIVRTAFGINTLPFCVRSSSPAILNAAIRFAVQMVCTTAECLAQCPDFSATQNRNLNVAVPASPLVNAVELTKERMPEIHKEATSEVHAQQSRNLPEAFDHAVAEFDTQRNQLIELGVDANRIGMALNDGFSSNDEDYPTLLPSRKQFADFRYPILINANPLRLGSDAIGYDEQTQEARIAMATSMTTIAFFHGIGCIRTRHPKDLFIANRMLEMFQHSNCLESQELNDSRCEL